MAAGTDLGAWVAHILSVSDAIWAFVIALTVWGAGWGLIALFTRRSDALPAVDEGPPPAEEQPPASPPPDAAPSEEEHVAGVLRWLITETEADVAIFVRLAPRGGERIVVEPRGLRPATVAVLAQAARDVLIQPSTDQPAGTAVARWLGSGGSKAVLLKGVAPTEAQEPLRFARFAIEWTGTPRGGNGSPGVETRLRSIPGVAWAESDGRDAAEVRVLVGENIDRALVEDAVHASLRATGVRVTWVEPSDDGHAPRARLVEVGVDTNGSVKANVALEWRGQELRGRGNAASIAGRSRAAADAAADALGPLLAGSVAVEGLYTHAHDDEDVVVVVVSLDGERLVGAVQAKEPDADASAARAVLDAVNRRLTLMAGGSGRI
ncbi:MAG TPA: hypothetical protein VE754_01195 [Actinomycetota bacterium]|nr:hypothetical protein [Actinomycetota bacterium]